MKTHDTKPARFTIKKDKRGKFRWHVTHGNPLIIADSGQGYARRATCVRAIHRFANAIETCGWEIV